VDRLEDAMGFRLEYTGSPWTSFPGWSGGAPETSVHVSPFPGGATDEPQGTGQISLRFEPEDSHIPDQALGFFAMMDELAPGSGSWALESFRNGDVGPLYEDAVIAQFGAARVVLRYGDMYEGIADEDITEGDVWLNFNP
jgi:hypothetical protein